MNALRRLLAVCCRVIFILLFILILTAAFRSVWSASKPSLYLFLALLVCALFLLRRLHLPSLRTLKRLQLLAHVFSLLCTLLIVLQCRVGLSWDWGHVIRNASALALEGELVFPSYCLQFPNNQFWLAVLTLFFKTIRLLYPSVTDWTLLYASMFLSIVLVRAACFFLYRSLSLLFGERCGRAADLLLMLYLPLSLYSYFAYTDTSALFCVSCLSYLYLLLRKADKAPWWLRISFAALTALLFKIKIMAFIVFLGILLADFLSASPSVGAFFKRYVPICALSAFFLLLLTVGTNAVIHLDRSESDAYSLPVVHWLMMGVNDHGGYRAKDVEFTSQFPTLAERRAAAREELERRLQARGFAGTLRFMAGQKLMRTWGNSLLGGDDYISRNPVHADSPGERFFAMKGDWHTICLLFSWPYHLFLLLGCLLSGLLGDRSDRLLFARLTLVGITLFLSVWECNSRYLFAYIPILFLCSMHGWLRLREQLLCRSKV